MLGGILLAAMGRLPARLGSGVDVSLCRDGPVRFLSNRRGWTTGRLSAQAAESVEKIWYIRGVSRLRLGCCQTDSQDLGIEGRGVSVDAPALSAQIPDDRLDSRPPQWRDA